VAPAVDGSPANCRATAPRPPGDGRGHDRAVHGAGGQARAGLRSELRRLISLHGMMAHPAGTRRIPFWEQPTPSLAD
jgi:hypothetical protein